MVGEIEDIDRLIQQGLDASICLGDVLHTGFVKGFAEAGDPFGKSDNSIGKLCTRPYVCSSPHVKSRGGF